MKNEAPDTSKLLSGDMISFIEKSVFDKQAQRLNKALELLARVHDNELLHGLEIQSEIWELLNDTCR